MQVMAVSLVSPVRTEGECGEDFRAEPGDDTVSCPL
jgi:hypothetical protein